MLFVCFTLLKLKKQFVQQKKNMFSQRKSSLGTSMELQVYTNTYTKGGAMYVVVPFRVIRQLIHVIFQAC